MMKKGFVLLLVFMLVFGIANGEIAGTEAELKDDFILDNFTLTLNMSWIAKEEKDNDAVLLKAETIDGENTLMVFHSGEGDETKNIELAAMNEYASGIMRDSSESINGINMIFASNADANTVCSYLSIKGSLYTVSISSHQKNCKIETLQEMLREIMKTVTVNL